MQAAGLPWARWYQDTAQDLHAQQKCQINYQIKIFSPALWI
jgi:hypothetical protein